MSPGPRADLGRFHPHAEVRKQVQGGEGTSGHSELVVEQEAQTFRLHSCVLGRRTEVGMVEDVGQVMRLDG